MRTAAPPAARPAQQNIFGRLHPARQLDTVDAPGCAIRTVQALSRAAAPGQHGMLRPRQVHSPVTVGIHETTVKLAEIHPPAAGGLASAAPLTVAPPMF